MATAATRPVDPDRHRSLRAACGRFATGVVIVAATTPDGPAGMAVNSFSSISLDPPLLGFGAARTSTTWPRLRGVGGFAVSVLAAAHGPLCRRFAQPGTDRFSGREWTLSPAGHPVLPDGLGWFDCTIADLHPVGDHELVIAAVTAWSASQGGTPLVFHGGTFLDLVAGAA
ncbi:flavin reductase family protein [uncultured Friedmanniella sp.]|uniref:flavin reductase family protein n=1 Tax=uncultured Friedmanniella sp. TaxID=335381 RepID=UPI0035CCA2DE